MQVRRTSKPKAESGDRRPSSDPFSPLTGARADAYANFLRSQAALRTVQEWLSDQATQGPTKVTVGADGIGFTGLSAPPPAPSQENEWIFGDLSDGLLTWPAVELLAEAAEAAYYPVTTNDDLHQLQPKIMRRAENFPERLRATRIESFVCGNTAAFGCVFEKTAIVAFRGSETELQDWSDNLSKKCVSHHFGSPPLKCGEAPNRDERVHLHDVHQGFARHVDRIHWQLENWIDRVLADGNARRIVLTGHSLGGASAQILGALWDQMGFPVEGVVTFAAPAVGGPLFSENYGLHDRTWRFEAMLDGVPHSLKLPFTPVGQTRIVHTLRGVDSARRSTSGLSVRSWAGAAAFPAAALFGGGVLSALGYLGVKYALPAAVEAREVYWSAHRMVNNYVRPIQAVLEAHMRESAPENADLLERHRKYTGTIRRLQHPSIGI